MKIYNTNNTNPNFLYIVLFTFIFFFCGANFCYGHEIKHPSNQQENKIKKLNFDLHDIEIKDFFSMIRKVENINIITGKNVRCILTLELSNTTWSAAVDAALRICFLEKLDLGDTIFVGNLSDIDKMSKQHPASQRAMFFNIKHARASDVADIIAKQPIMSASPSNVNIDKHNNRLIINVNKNDKNFDETLASTISKLDIPDKQISIESKIVSADTKVAKELGLKFWMINPKNQDASKKGDDNNDPHPAVTPNAGQFNFSIAKISDSGLLNMELDALENLGRVKMISDPRIVTTNNHAAYIESGQEIPYQEKTSGGATNIAFKKAVLSLRASPEIIFGQQLLLDLQINQDKISEITVNGVPAIQTQQIQTQIKINSGETVVLGGIYEYYTIENITRIPIISSIPIIGHLFQDKKTEKAKRELLIFVTPKIID